MPLAIVGVVQGPLIVVRFPCVVTMASIEMVEEAGISVSRSLVE